MKSPKAVSRLRDIDGVEQAFWIQAFGWSLVGVMFGSVVGLLIARLMSGDRG
jgi:hypothetical protein